MKHILDAIQAGDRSAETYAALPVPQSYRAATVHKDEVAMFEGAATRDKDPRKSLHIDEVPLPELAPGEALVAVMASAINYNTVWTERFGCAGDHDLFPFRNLHRVHVVFLGYLLDRLDALERLKGHAGLEFGFVSFPFGFHFMSLWFGFITHTLQPQS